MVRDPAVHREVIEKVTDYAMSICFQPLHLEYSPIKGPEGNIEYLLHLQKMPEDSVIEEPSFDIHETVRLAHESLDKKEKE